MQQTASNNKLTIYSNNSRTIRSLAFLILGATTRIISVKVHTEERSAVIAAEIKVALLERTVESGNWPKLFALFENKTDENKSLHFTDWTYFVFDANDIALASGDLVSFRLNYGDSVYKKVKATCPNYHENDRCVKIAAQMSFHFYSSAFYAPTHPKSNVRDFTTARWDILYQLVSRYDYKRYLEIGCEHNDSFNIMTRVVEVAVGVDPSSGGTLRMTSDEFFATNEEYFDLIFIDGLHEANQVYRDFRNAIQWLSPGGTIVFHDCNPSTETFASYPRHESAEHYWNGDTWKTAVAIRLHHDVEMVVVDVDHGVGVLRRRENRHLLSSEWQDLLGASPLSMLQWRHLSNHREELLTLVTVDEFLEWLG